MDVTIESRVVSDRRNHRVIAHTEVEWFSETYVLAPVGADHDGRMEPGDLAIIRGFPGLSALRLRRDNDGSVPMKVFSVRFPRDCLNSGFVGWLAARIKQELGTGIAVVCGYDPRSDDLFDYFGVPESVAARVAQFIEQLRVELPRAVDGAGIDTLADRRFRVIKTGPDSVIGPETIFDFAQQGNLVWAEYSGGRVRHGTLAGVIENSLLRFGFVQIQDDNEIASGNSEASLEIDGDGLKIVERFTWDHGVQGVNVLAEVT